MDVHLLCNTIWRHLERCRAGRNGRKPQGPFSFVRTSCCTRSATNIKTAKLFWRDFAPAWGFPFVFLYGPLASDRLGHPTWFFWFVAAPLFFWSGNRASSPDIQKKAHEWHDAFWGVLFPFIVWTFAVFSDFMLSVFLAKQRNRNGLSINHLNVRNRSRVCKNADLARLPSWPVREPDLKA